MKRFAVATVTVAVVLVATTQLEGQLFRRFRVPAHTCTTCRTPAVDTDVAETQQTKTDGGFQMQSGTKAPQVDQAEVLRMGDVVQHIDGSPQAGADDAFVQAMGPPEDDSDKWFISVITMKGCAACEKLKKDWATDPWLLALAVPDDPKQSWAYYNEYRRDDASQSWRFENIQLTQFPTIIVQPPRNGRYGDPSTVVFQGTYSGNPQQLAQQISSAIRLYLKKTGTPQGRFGQADQGAAGIDPPWNVPDRDADRRPLLPRPDGRPLIPPIPVEHEFKVPWQAIFTLVTAGVSVPAIIALVIWLLYFIRGRRKAMGKPLLLDDESLERLVELLQAIAEADGDRDKSRPASRSRKTTKRRRTASTR